MERALAQELRRSLKSGQEDVQSLSDKVYEVFSQMVADIGEFSFGLAVGYPMRVVLCRSLARASIPDVVVQLMSDPTDIDSKQRTFIHNRIKIVPKAKLFDALYKASLEGRKV